MARAFLLAAPVAILVAIGAGLLPLVYFSWQRGGTILPDAYAFRVLRFTLLQATLSTALSVVPAVFVARGFARQHFRGKNLLLALFAVPLALPVIVAIFGLTALYGTAGAFGGAINLYSLSGIVLAHMFFNLPLATRLLLEALHGTPPDYHRLAAQLNFSDVEVFRLVDWPVLKKPLPHVAALVFLLCASSFVIVLLLGGPQATTLEVAIYQSLRMDFDVTRALTLTALQILLSAVLVCASARSLLAPLASGTFSTKLIRYDGESLSARLLDCVMIGAAALFVVPVLASIVFNGVGNMALNNALLRALCTSLLIAMVSCGFALPLAWGIAQAQLRRTQYRNVFTGLSLAGYIVPPAVLSTGWFLAFRTFEGGVVLSVFLVAAMNSIMALPFALTVISPALEQAAQNHDRLCAHLNVQGWNRLVRVDLPAMRGAAAQALMMTVVLSMGDLTAVTLLGSQGLLTLPSLVQQQMGHYQSHAAGGTAFVLAGLCLAFTLSAQRLSRWT